MDNKKKGIASVSIFLVLLSGGWFANENNNRTTQEKGVDQPRVLNVQQLNVQQLDTQVIPTTIPFKPREYIRIGTRTLTR